MNDLTILRPQLDRIQQRALIVGVVGVVLMLAGALFSAQQFYQSYLLAFIYWMSFALGSFGILMLHHMVSGQWGYVIQRLIESGARTLPFMALLFIPVILGLNELYPWTNKEFVEANHLVHHKSGYLNIPFFLGRSAIYFVFWIGVAYMLSAWSRRQDQTADPLLTRKMRTVSGPGLVLYVLTVTFASVDWMMSLEPEWFSSIYGMLAIVSQALSTLALSIIVIRLLAEHAPFSKVLTERHFHHLGNLLLAFTVLWAYISFSQYLIIWSGNLPEDNIWYLRRMNPGWPIIASILIVGHFFVPFFLLLSRRTKKAIHVLAVVAAGILAMRFIDLFWLIVPAFSPDAFRIHWLDIVAPIAIGGIWVAVFVWQLKGSGSLLPLHDPRFSVGTHH